MANILYVYESDLKLAGEIDVSTGDLKEFIYSDESHSPEYMKAGATKYRFVKDNLGSIRLVVNTSTGTIVQRMDYNEWGKVLADTNPGFQPFGFAGGIYDSETRLARFGARDYDAEIGRWTSKDPILFDGGDTNLYGYTFNDPVNFIDPSGLFAENWIADRTTPGQQAGIGAGMVAGGASAVYAGFGTGNPALIFGGACSMYEGIKNIQKAKERGFESPLDIIVGFVFGCYISFRNYLFRKKRKSPGLEGI